MLTESSLAKFFGALPEADLPTKDDIEDNIKLFCSKIRDASFVFSMENFRGMVPLASVVAAVIKRSQQPVTEVEWFWLLK